MKSLLLLCIFVVFVVEFATSARCICKCCTSSGCDASTYSGSTTRSFDLSIVCNVATCNRASCSANFLGTCPIIGAAGDVDSTCGATTLDTHRVVMVLCVVLIGTVMRWSLY